jgi:nicotinate-nucleotide adenylyltransferase
MSQVSKRTVAVFGGSFNPPHLGHVLLAALLTSMEAADHILVIPTFIHPFHKPLAPFADRVQMCRLAMGWIPDLEVSSVEEELGGESRTLRTLEHLATLHPGWSMRLVMGADLLREAPAWHAFDRIKELAPPLVVGRAGVVGRDEANAKAPPSLLPEISSTQVRALVAAEAWTELETKVPHAVLAYLRSHRQDLLYK